MEWRSFTLDLRTCVLSDANATLSLQIPSRPRLLLSPANRHLLPGERASERKRTPVLQLTFPLLLPLFFSPPSYPRGQSRTRNLNDSFRRRALSPALFSRLFHSTTSLSRLSYASHHDILPVSFFFLLFLILTSPSMLGSFPPSRASSSSAPASTSRASASGPDPISSTAPSAATTRWPKGSSSNLSGGASAKSKRGGGLRALFGGGSLASQDTRRWVLSVRSAHLSASHSCAEVSRYADPLILQDPLAPRLLRRPGPTRHPHQPSISGRSQTSSSGASAVLGSGLDSQ